MAKIMVRWRDDANNQWQDERQQDVEGELDFIYFQTPGQYRTRQWEFNLTDAVPFTIIAAEEEVTPLGY